MDVLGSRPAAIVRVTGLLAAMRGDAMVARRSLREYLDLEQRYGQSRYIADQGQDVYDIEWLCGDLETARIALELSDRQLTAMNATNYRCTVLAQLARVLGRQGRANEALIAADQSERLAEPFDSDSLVLLHSARAVAYGRLEHFDKAIDAAETAIAVQTDCLCDLGEAWLSYAEVLVRAGSADDAITKAVRAIELFERKGVVAAADRAGRALAAIQTSRTWPADA